MTAKSYLKVLGLTLLTMLAVLYLAVVFVAVWNLIATDKYRWMDSEDIKVVAYSLFMLPLFTALCLAPFVSTSTS